MAGMPQGLYDAAREAFLGGLISWNGALPAKAFLVDIANYTIDYLLHYSLEDLSPGPGITIPTSQALAPPIANRTIISGIADGDDVIVPEAIGDISEAVVIALASGADGTSPLVLATTVGAGLPVTPSGGDILIHFSDGPYKIFSFANPP
jgi:hypothetical protein